MTGDTFKLTFGTASTGNIPVGSAASVVETDLNHLSSINTGGGSVDVTYDATTDIYAVAFDGGPLAGVTQPKITATTSSPATTAVISVSQDPATGTNEVQSVTVTGSATTSFNLGFEGQTTALALPVGSSAATVEAALDALSTIGPNGVTVAYDSTTGVYTITFDGTAFAGASQPQVTATTSSPGTIGDAGCRPGWLARRGCGRWGLATRWTQTAPRGHST